MCGRYHHGEMTDRYWEELHAFVRSLTRASRYNIAPTQKATVFRQSDAGRSAAELRWGLVPAWSQDAKRAAQAINARSETVREKPMFRAAFKKRRCLIPATGYYEWKKLSLKDKQPYSIQFADGRPMLFYGLWESWPGPKGAPLPEPLETFTIITTDGAPSISSIHDRMPCLTDVHAEHLDAWLDPEFQDYDFLQSLLRPSDEELAAIPISTYVNKVGNEGPQCVEPVEARG